jgi:hypothetical protein
MDENKSRVFGLFDRTAIGVVEDDIIFNRQSGHFHGVAVRDAPRLIDLINEAVYKHSPACSIVYCLRLPSRSERSALRLRQVPPHFPYIDEFNTYIVTCGRNTKPCTSPSNFVLQPRNLQKSISQPDLHPKSVLFLPATVKR